MTWQLKKAFNSLFVRERKPPTFFPTRNQVEINNEVFGGEFGSLNSEKFLISVASAWIKNGDFVIDAGANHGQHSRLFAQMVGLQGKVLCIEADPFICNSLSQGASASVVPIDVENAALGNFEAGEEILFYRHKTRDQEGSIFQRESSEIYESVRVPGRKLDYFAKDIVSFLKIDVEGAECELLKGSTSLLRSSSPLVGIELTRFPDAKINYDPEEFLELLDKLDYDIFNIFGELTNSNNWFDESFFMNHQNWLAKRQSDTHTFVRNEIPKLANSFTWGATNNVPYPFKLYDFPA